MHRTTGFFNSQDWDTLQLLIHLKKTKIYSQKLNQIPLKTEVYNKFNPYFF